MKVTEIFRKVRDSVSRYREDQEIRNLQQIKVLAERGLGYVAARGGAVPAPISEAEAKKRIEECDNALFMIWNRRISRSAVAKKRENSTLQF